MKAISDKADTSDLLQIEERGVPVLVRPESMLDTNQMAKAGLGIKMIIGPDDISVAQHKADNFVFDDNVTLMVNGQAKTISSSKAPVDKTNL